jgi:hypothetical protein
MDDWKLPWEGGCMCGQVRLRITAPPLISMACHCTGCQRFCASAFSLTLVIPSMGFTLLQGETDLGGLHGPHQHHFCPRCKNWIFTRPQGMPEIVNVRATMLDQHAWVEPFVETATAEKLPWAQTPAKRSYAGNPALEEYGPLMEAYRREGKRPD